MCMKPVDSVLGSSHIYPADTIIPTQYSLSPPDELHEHAHLTTMPTSKSGYRLQLREWQSQVHDPNPSCTRIQYKPQSICESICESTATHLYPLDQDLAPHHHFWGGGALWQEMHLTVQPNSFFSKPAGFPSEQSLNTVLPKYIKVTARAITPS